MAKNNKHSVLIVFAIIGGIAVFMMAIMALATKLFLPSSRLSFGDKIGVIPIYGVISDSDAITSQLVKFRKDKSIKAIILRINSPGGGVGASQEIYREGQKTTKSKKVIVSMGGVAASGGYYIASAADKIIANPGTITGSIGVIMEFVRYEEILKKIGIKFEVLKSGEFKDMGSPHREATEREKELIQALIADIQEQFVKAVADGRHLSLEKTRNLADGRIYSGAQARELGLVDDLGNFQDAVDIAKDLAGIKGDVSLVYPQKNRMRFFDKFIENIAGSIMKVMQGMKNQTGLEYRWNGLLI